MFSNGMTFKVSMLSKCLTTLALFVSMQASALGTKDGGGANICYIDGKPVLLEFADIRHELNEPGVKFETTKMMKQFGLTDGIQLTTESSLQKRIRAILTANYQYSPFVTNLLSEIVPYIKFSFTSSQIRVPVKADVSSQPLCQNGNVKASVVYLPSNLVLANLNVFNSLDLDSQAGLVLHEALRYLQFLQDDFTDSELQNLIRTLFDVYKGRSQDSVDTASFIEGFARDVRVDYIESTDLCLEDFTYYEAKKKVYKTLRLGDVAPFRSGYFRIFHEPRLLEEIRTQKNHDIGTASPVFAAACKLATTSSTWGEMKLQLQTLRHQLEKSAPELSDSPEKIAQLKAALDTAITNPFKYKNLTSEARAFVTHEVRYICNIWFHVWADLIAWDLEAEGRTDDKKRTAKKACNVRQNLDEWLRTGAANLKQEDMDVLLGTLTQKNPKCQ